MGRLRALRWGPWGLRIPSSALQETGRRFKAKASDLRKYAKKQVHFQERPSFEGQAPLECCTAPRAAWDISRAGGCWFKLELEVASGKASSEIPRFSTRNLKQAPQAQEALNGRFNALHSGPDHGGRQGG